MSGSKGLIDKKVTELVSEIYNRVDGRGVLAGSALAEALEIADAALRRAKAEGLEQVSELRKALELYRDASYQGHSSHWDKTGGSGSGCPACLRAIELRAQARQIVDTLDARAAQIERGEL